MTNHPTSWITVKSAGLYCKPGQFFIDPHYPVDYAIITHGHADHARPGHKKVLATAETLKIMKARYGDQAGLLQPLKYHRPIVHREVKISFIPAGHIIGSAQILLEYHGSRLIISGDYKRRTDPTCLPFEVVPCDVFITEATFGLPIFIHPPIEDEINKLLTSLQQHPMRCHLIGAYALGKCQRLMLALREQGYDRPFYLHGAMLKLCELYQSLGFSFGELTPVTAQNARDLGGEIVFCPPSALQDRWSRKLPHSLIGYASGWMQVRARAKQKGVELPLIVSDHADWNELTQTIQQVKAPEIWVTHGNEEALVYYATSQGLQAKAVANLHYEDEDD
ncbi:MAG: ligase-associated DNA damage response exonuclease [Gammaproteobacteria bacterium]|nr:ligase-associated DNA damage response exonuclease [Gammaproteobacteria bacterium]